MADIETGMMVFRRNFPRPGFDGDLLRMEGIVLGVGSKVARVLWHYCKKGKRSEYVENYQFLSSLVPIPPREE